MASGWVKLICPDWLLFDWFIIHFCWILPFVLCPVRVEINCCFILFKKQGPSYWAPLQLSYLALSFQFLPVCCCSYCYCCYLDAGRMISLYNLKVSDLQLSPDWIMTSKNLRTQRRLNAAVVYCLLRWVSYLGHWSVLDFVFPFFNLWKFPLILFPHKYS